MRIFLRSERLSFRRINFDSTTTSITAIVLTGTLVQPLSRLRQKAGADARIRNNLASATVPVIVHCNVRATLMGHSFPRRPDNRNDADLCLR